MQAGNNNYDNRISLTGTNIDNAGELDLLTGHNASFSFSDASTFTNETTGVVNFGHESYGFSQPGGTIVNRGVITADPGTSGGYYLQIGSSAFPLDNPGTLILKSGSGTVAGKIPQVSDDLTKLTGGTWEALGGSSLNLPNSLLTENDATVVLSGPGAQFAYINNIAVNAGSISVLAGAGLNVSTFGGDPSSFTNTGTLEIGADSTVNVTADYTQSGAGTLLLRVGGTAASGHYGKLTVAGQATLDGELQIIVDSDPLPPAGNVFPLVSFGTMSGSFATENGVAPFFTEAQTATGFTFTSQNVPSDLMPTGITIPASGLAGQNVTIGYTIHNGATVVTNSSHWSDSIFLSTSATLDGSAVLLGRVAHTGSLAGGASYTGSLTAAVPPLFSGDYHVFVVADSRNQVAESSDANNSLAATSTLHIDVPVLTFGTPLNGTVAAGQDELYLVHLPAGADHLSLTSTIAGLAELYLKKGAPPTVSGADFFAYDPTSTAQNINVPQGSGADYYLLVHGREGAGAGGSFTLDAEAIPFGITDIGPVAATNNGPVTLAIHGGQFSAGTVFELVQHGTSSVVASTKVAVQDGTLAYATFDLKNQPATAFDVVAINGGSTVTDASAFQVLPAPLGDPGVQVILSFSNASATRVGRAGTVVVSYHNLSGHDVPAPLIVLSSDNANFLDGDEQYTQFVEFYGLNTSGGSEDTLPADYIGQRLFQYLPQIEQTGLTTHLRLSLAPPATPLSLDKLDIEARPAGEYTDAQWDVIRAQLITQVGPTYGDYARVLQGDIHLLPDSAGDRRSPIDLLQIEVQKAEAAVFPSIHGQLGAAPAGVSLADSLVVAQNTDTGAVFSTRSLNDGSFVFGDITPGHYTFQFDEALVTNAGAVAVAVGQHNAPVTLSLAPAAHLTGSVGATAISGVVTVVGSTGASFSALVDETGHYRFGALPAGVYSLTVEADGFARVDRDHVSVVLGTNSLDVAPPAEAIFTGHITTHAGGPAGFATVSAFSTTDVNAAPFVAGVNADGTYALHGLPGGTYDLSVEEGGYVTAKIGTSTLTTGQTTALPETALVVPGSIAGTVTGDAAVFSGEQVGAYLNGVVAAVATVGADGKFLLGDLAPGAYAIHPVDQVAFSTTKNVTLAEGQKFTGASITSYAGGEITGTVRHGSDVFPRIGVAATAADGTVLHTRTDDQGHYDFTGLAAGSYTVQVEAGDAATGTAKVTVATLKTSVTKDLVSNATAHIHGLLSTNGTTPVANGFVELLEGGRVVASMTTDVDGLYSFQTSDTGSFAVRAVADTATFAAGAAFAVAAGADVAQNLTAGTGTLHVAVSDSAGSVTGARVVLIDPVLGRTITSVALGASGTVDFAHLAPGNYSVYVSQTGGRGGLVPATVAAGTANAPVALAAQGTLTGHVTGGPAGTGAEVDAYLNGSPGVGFSVIAAADGSYSLSNLPAGSYTVRAISDGLAAPVQKSGVTVGSGTVNEDLAVTTTGGRIVDGRIVGPMGIPLPNATVQFLDVNNQFLGQAVADSKGNFELRLPAGTVHLKIFSQDNTPVDFLGTLQVNEPPPNMPDVILAFGDIETSASRADLDVFDAISGVLNAITFGNLTNSFDLYTKVKKEALDVFMKSKVHVNGLPNGSSNCPGCIPEFQAAGTAVERQNAAYDKWEYDYHKLLDDSIKGQETIKNELGTNLKTFIDTASLFVGIGELALEAKAAEAAAKEGAALLSGAAAAEPAAANIAALYGNMINSLREVGTSAYDVTTLVNNGFQGTDAPADDVDYVRQVASGSNNVVALFGNFVSAAVKLEGEASTLLKKGNAFVGALDKILNYQSTIEALTFTKSAEDAKKVETDLETFHKSQDPYEESATKAHQKKVALENCLKNNAADSRCNPNPKPGPPGPGNYPIPPDGPGATSSSTQSRSLDPNSLDGPTGFGAAHFVSAQNPLAYTVHFENVAAATAPAAEVKIVEQLDSDLDFATFQLGDFTFGDFHLSVPAGHSSYSLHDIDATATLGVKVNFDASVNLQTGVVTWDLQAIDPATGDLPSDANIGFLPPNVHAPEGEGSVSYTVSAKTSTATGATIAAQADVFFDANDPIATPIHTNTFDALAPTSHASTPAVAGPEFTVAWSGQDDAGGSGIAFYDVYAKDDSVANSTFQPFLLGTTHSAGIFSGVAGHTYEFFSVAQDGAGNREAQPTIADATITPGSGSSYAISASSPGHYLDSAGKSYTVTLTGAGLATVTFVDGLADAAHADIRSILLTGTTAASALTIKESAGGSLHVGRISSGALGLGSVTISKGVTLGDGLDDGAADLGIGGTLGKLSLADLNANALLVVGDKLATPAAAKPLASVTIGNILGDGVQTDFAIKTGAVAIQSWTHQGSFGARLGAASLAIGSGAFDADVSIHAGDLGTFKAAGAVTGADWNISGKIGSLTIAGMTDTKITGGAIGNITSSASISGSTLLSLAGGIGNLTVNLAKQTGAVNAFAGDSFTGYSIGNLTATVSGLAGLTSAHGLVNSSLEATVANIGKITATVSGPALVDGAAIDASSAVAGGNIGNVTARITSASGAATLAALRATSFYAGQNLGAITAVATGSTKTGATGRVSAVRDVNTQMTFSAIGSIGLLTAAATGGHDAVAIDIDAGDRLHVFAFGDLAGASITATKSATVGAGAHAIARASFDGENIGAFTVAGDATTDQVEDIAITAASRIASVSIAAKDGIHGTIRDSAVVAGQFRTLANKADLTAGGLGLLKVSGSLVNTKVGAAGNIGAITVGHEVTGSLFVAGDAAGSDAVLLSSDDTYFRAASIASLKVGGALSTTTVAAGIDPGADRSFGGADDLLGLATVGVSTGGRVGAIVLGANTVTLGVTNPFLPNPTLAHQYTIEAATLTSITVGKLKPLKTFTQPIDLSSTGTEQVTDALIRQVGP